MKIRFLWIKLNIYALLLCGLVGAAALIFFSIECLHDTLWKIIMFAVAALYLLHKVLFIVGQYQHKKEVMARLITTSRKEGFTPRRFMLYMDSLCMQRMVYLTLTELNLPHEFANLKARKKSGDTYPAGTKAYYEFKDGKLKLVLIEPGKTGEQK